MSERTHTCPRRMSEIGPWAREENLDTYAGRSGLIGQPLGCSFCGSMPSDDFMAHARAGRPISATDKSYKIYVEQIPRDGDPDEPRVISHANHAISGARRWVDLTEVEREAVRKYDNGFLAQEGRSVEEDWWAFVPWGRTVEGKFYTPHLTAEQGHEFWGLHQQGKVNWSYAPYRPLYLPGPSDEAAR